MRFALADTWIWAKDHPHKSRAGGPYGYNIHGIVSVMSDARLPELERFRIGELIGEPDVRVRLAKTVSEVAPAVFYREGIGGLGFAVSIRLGDQIEATASRFLRWSPHVLYTNIVEPILRWKFAERGYALVHGACS